MMICIKEQYFKFNRIILLTVGLWPYQQSTLVRAQLALFLGVLMSYIVFQVHSYFWYYILLFNGIIYYFTKYHQNENIIFWYYILINILPIYLTYFLLQLFRVLFLERSFEFIIRILPFSTFFIFLLINYLSLSTNMKTASQSFIKTYLQK